MDTAEKPNQLIVHPGEETVRDNIGPGLRKSNHSGDIFVPVIGSRYPLNCGYQGSDLFFLLGLPPLHGAVLTDFTPASKVQGPQSEE